jgi:CHAT domain-containing protein
MKKLKYMTIPLAILFCLTVSVQADSNEKEQLIQKGGDLFEQGEFAEAGKLFEKTLPILNQETEADKYLETAMKLAECYKALGYHQRALPVFQQALPVLKKSRDRYRNAAFLNSLADLYFTLGETQTMVKYLLSSVDEARQADNPRLLAAILNDLGNALAWSEDYESALAAYTQCLDILAADQSKSGIDLNLKAQLNKIRSLYLNTESGKALALLDQTFAVFNKLPDNYNKVIHLLSAHSVLEELLNSDRIDPDTESKLFYPADQILQQALEIAKKIRNSKLISYAYGYSGRLREEGAHYREAKKLTGSAIFFARQSNAPEILYLWQWQMGRILAAENKPKQALEFYNQAVATLNPIRTELFAGYRYQKDFFNLRVKPVYLGLAELLLKQAEKTKDKTAYKNRMFAARDTMEILKTAELQDFFQDECSVATQTKMTKLNKTPGKTLLLYPISLENSLILLATFPDGMRHKIVPVEQKELKKIANRFRTDLQNVTSKDFFTDAQKLYNWLIRPLEENLTKQQIDSIVIAPDGALRLIPFSTLHDGEKFLIEKYAIGTVPAISLTEMQAFQSGDSEILISGLSHGVQGFAPLPSVEAELKDIKDIMQGEKAYLNAEHNLSNLTREFQNKAYSIVHFATHGAFGGSSEKTFLLLYEDKLNMNQLSRLIDYGRYRNSQVELLTLSACQTAMGDERAALGLAGVAVKAGVKSVVATLWFVDDEATSLAIIEFYRQLKTPGISKAKALQNAQKMLIAQKRFQHPAYWAPFLLIGNWL